jgi:hypothetical protein
MPARAQIARIAALVAAIALTLPAAATAASQDGNYNGQFRGVVQAGGQDQPSGNNDPRAAGQATLPGDLTWHGGPVMHTNRTHLIYWEPSGHTTTAAYKSLVNQYMTDVAAASGRVDNVYAANTQYTDSTGAADYASTFAGALVDANAYPSNGCSHPQALSICLTDPQIRTQLDAFLTANSLPRGMGDIYFVLTPQGVGSCFDSSASSCSYTKYCAYHSDFLPAAGRTIYAMQPWADVSACAVGDSPNANSAADNMINLISHEHNESITDPLADGWWDPADGKENGDKCAWNFGGTYRAGNGAPANAHIGNRDFLLQQMWANTGAGFCAQRLAAPMGAGTPSGCGSMGAGQAITVGQSLRSCDGRFTLAMQYDGNLVLYQGGSAIWATNNSGSTGYAAVMQNDGNFVLYDVTQRALFSSGTWGHPGNRLSLQNDGNLVVYNSAGGAVWASNTCCR